MSIGIWQVVLILLIVVIIFGAGKLPQVMGDVAKGVKSFKSGLKDDEPPPQAAAERAGRSPAEPVRRRTSTPAAEPGAPLVGVRSMFDIGWSEMAVILMVALIVIGPKDLPRVARTIGKWTGKARGMAREFQRSLDDMAREAELQDIKAEIDKLSRVDVRHRLEETIDPEGELRRSLEAPVGAGSARRADMAELDEPEASRARPSRGRAGPAGHPAPAAPDAAERRRPSRRPRTPRREELMAIIKDIDEREMPLLDHLVELRNRLMYSAAAIILGFLVCYAFADDIYAFLVRPLAKIYESMGYHRPADDLHRPDRGVLHLHQGRVLGRGLHHLPVRRHPALAVHRPRPVPEREGGLPAVPGGDAGPVLRRRRFRLLLHLPDGLALLPRASRPPVAGRASCRSSSRPGSASISTW